MSTHGERDFGEQCRHSIDDRGLDRASQENETVQNAKETVPRIREAAEIVLVSIEQGEETRRGKLGFIYIVVLTHTRSLSK